MIYAGGDWKLWFFLWDGKTILTRAGIKFEINYDIGAHDDFMAFSSDLIGLRDICVGY